ncbi:MAG TPA: DUF4445 domain-containing protein [Candidatus Limivicinus faecipullorum]|nr:DUF4445 domain-containing protein [Candidatus Limivicinus faecipullorum]
MSRILARQGAGDFAIKAEKGESLLDALRRSGLDFPAPCGGNGKCGKCRVEIDAGGRRESVLACRYRIDGDISLYLPEQSGGEICREGKQVDITYKAGHESGRHGLGAAVDIGTTTLAVRLYDLEQGRELGSRGAWNSQSPFGADVISRCQYIMERDDGLELLKERIQSQIFAMIGELAADCGRAGEKPEELFAAGNTVMEHIFLGLSPAGMAVTPFRPISLFTEREPVYIRNIKTFLSPCVAAYVGGDITAGLLSSGLWDREGLNLFLDVGTNGEMALGGREGFVCCAVASGPAFEGAGISCGMPSTTGAIAEVKWTEKGFEAEAIGGGEAKGLCGSGLISLLALLLELGAVDEWGRLLPPEEAPEELRPWLSEDDNGNGCFHLTGKVYLSAGDVRQLQLAKAAVAAGIEVLTEELGICAGDIGGAYIAGGFGSHLDLRAAAAIGMLPEELADRAEALGNSALGGAAMALLDTDSREELYRIQEKCRYIELTGDARFNRAFPAHMTFGKEDELEWN